MQTDIQKIHAFAIAGLKAEDIDTSLCPAIWERFFELYDEETLSELGDGRFFGACIPADNPGRIHYLAGVHISNIRKASQLGMEIMEVASMEYGILSLSGPAPECIHKGWKYAWETFFPTNNCTHARTTDYEYYPKGPRNDPAYKMELWLPIQRDND